MTYLVQHCQSLLPTERGVVVLVEEDKAKTQMARWVILAPRQVLRRRLRH